MLFKFAAVSYHHSYYYYTSNFLLVLCKFLEALELAIIAKKGAAAAAHYCYMHACMNKWS